MKSIWMALPMAGLIFLTMDDGADGRGAGGRGGGGGARGGGGGARVSGGGGARVNSGARVNTGAGSFGGSGARAGTGGSVVGPGGGRVGAGAGSGSIEGPRGGNIDYAGAAVGGKGPAGGAAAKGVGGAKYTTPGGNTVGKVGAGGAAVGPGRNVAVGGSRGVVAGPNRAGTYNRSTAAVRNQGVAVRNNFNSFHNYNYFNANWCRGHPGAWFTAGWAAGRVWNWCNWNTLSAYCAYPADPIYYDYGTSVIYEGDTVYVDGESVATTTEYATQATAIADVGRAAKPPEKEEWESLGVFAMVQGDAESSDKIFQLAVNKAGIIRGNYYDALADNTMPVYGSVDKKTQRAAWSIGEKKEIVFEAGIANLTKEETTVLVHSGKDKTQQFTLVRIEKPEDPKPDGE